MMTQHPWWRGAVVYQIYLRSFCDGNGDGQGDFAGLISKLDYISALGVDAIWLSPIHPSPNRDWGYDVSDYEDVHPDYGSLADFETLLAAAHSRGLKVLLDEVLCHTRTNMHGSPKVSARMMRRHIGMSGRIHAKMAPHRTIGCRHSPDQPGRISRAGGNITITNFCASSPRKLAERGRARSGAECARFLAGARRGRIPARCGECLFTRHGADG